MATLFKEYKVYSSLAMDVVVEEFLKQPQGPLCRLDMGKGVSAFNVFNHLDIKLDSSLLSDHTSYGDFNGLTSLRQAVSQYYRDKFNYDLDPRRICITDGASGALTIVFAILANNGGPFILPESGYPLYRIYANLFGVDYLLSPLREGDFHIDIPALEQLLVQRPCGMVINSPNNPHGAVLSAAELDELANMDVPIVFDEVYQSLPLTDNPIPSAIYHSDRHFVINSFSKSLAIAGFRLGYLIVPEHYVDKMTNAKATMSICTSLPSQLVGEILLRNWDVLIDKHQRMLRENWLEIQGQIEKHGLKLYAKPEAGFFATIDISATGLDSLAVSLDLARNYALNTAPGIDFETDAADYVRLNFASPRQNIAEAISRFATYLQKNGG